MIDKPKMSNLTNELRPMNHRVAPLVPSPCLGGLEVDLPSSKLQVSGSQVKEALKP